MSTAQQRTPRPDTVLARILAHVLDAGAPVKGSQVARALGLAHYASVSCALNVLLNRGLIERLGRKRFASWTKPKPVEEQAWLALARSWITTNTLENA